MHRNAKTTPKSRELLVRRVTEQGMTPAAAAAAAGVSAKPAHKWIARFRSEGLSGLEDRRSRPKQSPRSTPKEVVSRILALRHQRLVAQAIAQRLKLSRSTVGLVLRRNGVGRLPRLGPKVPIVRYE